jgi:hypothetical protein
MTPIFALEFLWITLVPALASLITSAIVLRATSASFVKHVVTGLHLAREILNHHVRQHFEPFDKESREQGLTNLQKSLLGCSDDLSSAYHKAVFEFRISKFSSELLTWSSVNPI